MVQRPCQLALISLHHSRSAAKLAISASSAFATRLRARAPLTLVTRSGQRTAAMRCGEKTGRKMKKRSGRSGRERCAVGEGCAVKVRCDRFPRAQSQRIAPDGIVYFGPNVRRKSLMRGVLITTCFPNSSCSDRACRCRAETRRCARHAPREATACSRGPRPWDIIRRNASPARALAA